MATTSSTSVKLSQSIQSSRKDFINKLLILIKFPLLFFNMTGIIVMENSTSLSSKSVSRIRRKFLMLKLAVIGFMHLYNLARVATFVSVRLSGNNHANELLLLSLCMLYAATNFVCENLTMRMSLEPMIQALQDYNQKFGFLHDIVGKKVKFAKVYTILMLTLNIVFAGASLFIGSQWYRFSEVMIPFIPARTDTVSMYVNFASFCIVNTLILMTIQGSILLHTLFLWVMVVEFRATSRFMAESLKVCDDQTEERFNLCRERHQSLCRILRTFNKFSRVFVSTNIFFNMTNIFIYIYDLGSVIKMPGFWAARSLGGIGLNVAASLFVSYQWGKLPNAVHSIVDAVADVDWSVMSKDLIQKMGLLLDRCGSQKIGVNVFGMFTVDSSTPMMVMGTMLTYGIVVLQFQVDNNNICSCPGNTTNL